MSYGWRVLLLCWALPLLADSAPVFTNFSHSLALQPYHQDYLIAAANQPVRVSTRLLVRVNQAFVADIPIPDITGPARILYQSPTLDYRLLQLRDGADLFAAMDAVRRQPGVELVQPDLLQLERRGYHSQQAVLSDSRIDVIEQLQQLRDRLWQGSRGQGIRIALIDDGVDFRSEALGHPDTLFQYDVGSQQADASPRSGRDRHGTALALLWFARQPALQPGDLAGLVPEAGLIAIRQPDTWTSHTLLAFQLAALAGADVINCSWTSSLLLEPVADVVRDLALHGRGGKGTAIVFAAGNDGQEIEPGQSEAALADALVVGATDSRGHLLAHSNRGGSVDFYTLGSELPVSLPGLRHFSGTSLAAGLVTAMTALLLAQQPDLSLSQLQQQLLSLEGIAPGAGSQPFSGGH
ncbi:S8 family peptidase [Parathalassolituus penaei]|uniref:S8 family serine peptidase n=1 Tax=Parathalassolituus penaei TaxID=2997323 RepID=A0A9X3ITH0_9GAMM|nr:S8 family serine peptidase [Parathalassolituus penaei]MCY0965183.1 S8 family serine peptidase [Parathalassolituus penaei]